MRFKHRAWIPIAWSLSVINVGAVWFAALPAEPTHATIHALLAVGFALGARRLTARGHGALPNEDLQQALDQNEQMQQTIELLEERVDFAERLVAQQKDASRQPLQP